MTFLLLGVYVVYDYHKELRLNLQNSMGVLADDVVRHELYRNDPNTIKASFHLLEGYHEAPFIALFDHLTFSIVEALPTAQEECRVIRELPQERYLVVRSGLDAVNAKTLSFVYKLLSVFGSVLLLFILIFAYFLNRLFLPLRCLVRFCKDLSGEKESMPLCAGSAEVTNLKKAVVGLLESNQTKQDIFKEAAHEIKSPLAILKARLSLFKQNDDCEKAAFIRESEDDIRTISNKLRELLFLKEIEWDMQKRKESVPMQALFENIFMHTKNNTTITNHVDSKNRRLHIVNEMGSKSDETLFSSYIGSKMIARLAEKLDYTYTVKEQEGLFYTTIAFNASEDVS